MIVLYRRPCPVCGIVVEVIYVASEWLWFPVGHHNPEGKWCSTGCDTVCDDPFTYAAKRIEAAKESLKGGD